MTSQATRRRIEGDRRPLRQELDGEFLSEMTGEALLRAYASLTHRLHDSSKGAGRGIGPAEPKRREWRQAADAVREQRDLIEAEVLRRMGETR